MKILLLKLAFNSSKNVNSINWCLPLFIKALFGGRGKTSLQNNCTKRYGSDRLERNLIFTDSSASEATDSFWRLVLKDCSWNFLWYLQAIIWHFPQSAFPEQKNIVFCFLKSVLQDCGLICLGEKCITIPAYFSFVNCFFIAVKKDCFCLAKFYWNGAHQGGCSSHVLMNCSQEDIFALFCELLAEDIESEHIQGLAPKQCLFCVIIIFNVDTSINFL